MFSATTIFILSEEISSDAADIPANTKELNVALFPSAGLAIL